MRLLLCILTFINLFSIYSIKAFSKEEFDEKLAIAEAKKHYKECINSIPKEGVISRENLKKKWRKNN